MNHYRIIRADTDETLGEAVAGSPEQACDALAEASPYASLVLANRRETGRAWLANGFVRVVDLGPVPKGGDA